MLRLVRGLSAVVVNGKFPYGKMSEGLSTYTKIDRFKVYHAYMGDYVPADTKLPTTNAANQL